MLYHTIVGMRARVAFVRECVLRAVFGVRCERVCAGACMCVRVLFCVSFIEISFIFT